MVELKNVTKTLKSKVILSNVSYKFEKGKIYGLYGHNGSGKTMLLRTISGLVIPSSGEVIIDDKILHKDISFPENVGIVIENMELLPRYNAYTNLKILSKIRGVANDEDISNNLVRVGLNTDIKVKKYSLGMKQRLNIAQAVFEKQDLILLDEPTNAIDSDGVKLIYKIIKEEKQRGATIIIATHHKEDLEELCDCIINVSEGVINYNEK